MTLYFSSLATLLGVLRHLRLVDWGIPPTIMSVPELPPSATLRVACRKRNLDSRLRGNDEVDSAPPLADHWLGEFATARG